MENIESKLRELEQRLTAAQERQSASSKAMSGKGKGGTQEEWWAAHKALLVAERELAAAKGEEYAEPLDFPVQWDTGAPLPHLLVNDYRAFLTFYVRVVDPKWDGSYVTIKRPSSDQYESLALVEFKRCMSAKLGSPNDEVLHGHPLQGKGLAAYTAQIVRNSRWIAEIERINSVHRGYRPEFWKTLHHYVLWFHDTTFECIAESFLVELRNCSMGELLAEVCQRLVG